MFRVSLGNVFEGVAADLLFVYIIILLRSVNICSAHEVTSNYGQSQLTWSQQHFRGRQFLKNVDIRTGMNGQSESQPARFALTSMDI